jgi:hypothetical protein
LCRLAPAIKYKSYPINKLHPFYGSSNEEEAEICVCLMPVIVVWLCGGIGRSKDLTKEEKESGRDVEWFCVVMIDSYDNLNDVS